MDTLPASALLSTPFQRLGAEGWEKGPGQAELMRRWRGGQGNGRHIPPVVWPMPEDEKTQGVTEGRRQSNSPWRDKDVHVLTHGPHNYAVFCGNEGLSLLISLI